MEAMVCGAFQPPNPPYRPYRCTRTAGHPGHHWATVDGKKVADWSRLSKPGTTT